MITLKEYLSDPCGTLSIPLWKWRQTVLPEGIKIVHQRDFVSQGDYQDDPYFRLRHDLDSLKPTQQDMCVIKKADERDILNIVSIINSSYLNIQVTQQQVQAWRQYPVYAPDLWLIAFDRKSGKPIGCGIADFDRDTKEGILEWIQVLPEYRGRGIGKLLVLQLLWRLQGKADFVTVSGSCLNEFNPEKLYRSCGFVGDDVWHILRKI